jgi:hypothetical protein
MSVAKVVVKYSLLSLFVAPAALAFAVLRADVVARSTMLALVGDYGSAYVFAALSFGLGLLIAGAFSGLLVTAVARRSRAFRASVSIMAPTILFPCEHRCVVHYILDGYSVDPKW